MNEVNKRAYFVLLTGFNLTNEEGHNSSLAFLDLGTLLDRKAESPAAVLFSILR